MGNNEEMVRKIMEKIIINNHLDVSDEITDLLRSGAYDISRMEKCLETEKEKEKSKNKRQWYNILSKLNLTLSDNTSGEGEGKTYAFAGPVYFDGDILITDPCYFIKDEDWEKSSFGSDIKQFGFTNYITQDTLFGDWTCVVFDSHTGEDMGYFTADAGLVGIYLFDEVKRYNPKLNLSHYTYTIINNFKGKIKFQMEEAKGVYTKKDEIIINGEVCCKAGEPYTEYILRLYGKGTDKKTGRRLDFESDLALD